MQEDTTSKTNFRFGLNLNPANRRLFHYCVTILFFYLADSIMAYTTPNYLKQNLSSAALMGMVFATSSMAGFTVDFLMGGLFTNKNYRFFLRWSLILALGFPLGFILFPAHITTFIVGLALWGIYYEFLGFSNSQFIIEKTDKHQHEVAWGIIFFLELQL